MIPLNSKPPLHSKSPNSKISLNSKIPLNSKVSFDNKEWSDWLIQVENFLKIRNSSISPLFSRKENDTRPYLAVSIKNTKILALVDSGSNNCILGSSGFYLLKQLHLDIKCDTFLNVSTADGKVQDYLGFVDIPITLNGISRYMKVLVIPSVVHELILGIDFLKIFKIKADFDNLTFDAKINSSCNVINSILDKNDLSDTQQSQLDNIIDLYKSIDSSDKLGLTSVISHSIDTGDAKPIRQRQYPLSPKMQEYLVKEVHEMLKLNIIQPSQSPWCSPLWLVKKKSGEFRVVYDSRKLNTVCLRDSYPMPRIDIILSKLRDARYLTSLDLRKAFHQIPLEASSRPKTAFAVQGLGLFEYKVMPFGLLNSAATMQRAMDLILGPELEPSCFVYLDDIIISTPTFESHIKVLNQVFERLKKANLTINLEKCNFCRSSLNYLGFVVDKQGLHTSDEKVSAVNNFPIPRNTTEIKRLLGLVGWYRRFIKDFASISSPITDLLKGRKKGQAIKWTEEADKAFIEIKHRLTSAPVLASPDFSKPFFIQTDSSDTGMGAVIFQEEEGYEHPIAYASKTLNKCQRKYSVSEKEMLALIFGIEHFRSYIEGTSFTVITDHAALVWLHSLSNPAGKLARWALKLSQFDFKVIHRKGSLNVVADALSRAVPELSNDFNYETEISVLDVSTLQFDKWYTDMVFKVSKSPNLYPTFCVIDNLLYKHIINNHGIQSNLNEWKLIIPTRNRKDILKLFHDDECAGHFGISKTLSRIISLYYWPGIRKDVYRYVRKCEVCQANKAPNQSCPGLMGNCREINFPFQMLSADLLGPYVRSKQGNRFVLVVVDWFTKFVLVHPMTNATTKSITKFLENQVFLIYGVPQIFACDNGPQFISKDFKKLLKDYNVQKIFYNLRYHPQANHTERVNRDIVRCIRSYIHDNHKDWDLNIHKVGQAIRTAKHEVTGFSPAFLTFGRNVPISGAYYGKIANNNDNIPLISDKNKYVNDLEDLPNLFTDIRNRIKSYHDKNSKRYNLRKRDVSYQVGDKLWKKNFTLSSAANDYSAKFAPKYVPCVVNKVLSKISYNLVDKDGNDLGNWHISELKDNFSDSDSEDNSDQ